MAPTRRLGRVDNGSHPRVTPGLPLNTHAIPTAASVGPARAPSIWNSSMGGLNGNRPKPFLLSSNGRAAIHVPPKAIAKNAVSEWCAINLRNGEALGVDAVL